MGSGGNPEGVPPLPASLPGGGGALRRRVHPRRGPPGGGIRAPRGDPFFKNFRFTPGAGEKGGRKMDSADAGQQEKKVWDGMGDLGPV